MNRINQIIEKVSMTIVMADKDDPDALKDVLGALNQFKELPEIPGDERISRILTAAGAMSAFAGENPDKPVFDTAKKLEVLGRAAGALQILAGGSGHPEEVSFPEELGIKSTGNIALETEMNSLYFSLCRLSSLASASNRKETARAAMLFAGIIEKISVKKPPEKNSFSAAMNAWNAAAGELTGVAAEIVTGEDIQTQLAAKIEVEAENIAYETVELNADISLLNDFVSEANEHTESAEKHMLVLEKERTNKESINTVFRAFHTLKSLSGFLGLEDLNLLVKETENLLAKIRKEEIAITGNVIELLYTSVDLLKKMIRNISHALKTGGKMARETNLSGHANDLKKAADAKETRPEAVSPPAGAEYRSEIQQTAASQLKETVKIDSVKLDRLIDTIGEIVIAESMINSDNSAMMLASNDYFKNISHLNKTTKRLHELGLALRLVPLSPVMQKMERIVRDLAKTHNKKINFTSTGEETEIDRSIVEKIHDPLVHMLRNAVDHGLEKNGAERKKAGKPETAEIRINAFHRGGNIVIEVTDDGRGLDREKILARGVENGLILAGSAALDHEIYSLIFRPGFSTASVVTDTSGRGVGMDVVKRNIDELKGRIDIDTVPGKGTKFTITLPITTAIIEAMVIKVKSDKYLLPTLSIIESIRADESNLSTVTGKGMVINLRGKMLPVFSLRKLFFGSDESLADVMGKIIVIVEDGEISTGIIVDNILEQQQVVVKSMSKGINRTDGIAGCTIMSDGRVGLILDVSGIIKLALQKPGEKTNPVPAAAIKK